MSLAIVMPFTGIYDPEGAYDYLSRLTEDTFIPLLLYCRDKNLIEPYIRLMKENARFIGIKIATEPSDVDALVSNVPDKAIIWGAGDYKSTEAARHGARGHTSGWGLLFPMVSDAINRMQREGKFDDSQVLEDLLLHIERIRLDAGRPHNRSSVAYAIQYALEKGAVQGLVSDNGAPMNPLPPQEKRTIIEAHVLQFKDLGYFPNL